jgi:hypothetical protein
VGEGAEYLVFLPDEEHVSNILSKLSIENVFSMSLHDGTVQVDLSASAGELLVEWFQPLTGDRIEGEPVQGGSTLTFHAPFSGDAVLYIFDRLP